MDNTVNVELAYGQGWLPVSLPADAHVTVVEPTYHPAVPDEAAYLREVLSNPIAGRRLRDRVKPGQTMAISMCDLTRPQPRDLMIPAILDEVAGIIDPDDIVVLVATGTHRGNTDDEIRQMLGDELAARLHIVNHDARDKASLTWMGEFGNGVPVWLNTLWAEADIKVTTGFVEPHFFAGFSGGPKLVAPGLAGLDTVLTLHNAARIGDQRATWGEIDDNPVHSDIRAIAAGTGVTFAFDVILNRDKKIVKGFAGDLFEMHEAARAAAREIAMAPVDGLFDIVITTNSGFPLDQNLYQAVRECRRPSPLSSPAARSSAPPNAATASPITGRIGRCWPRRPHRRHCLPTSRRASRPFPTSGRCRSRPRSSRAPTSSCTPRICRTPNSRRRT